MRTPNRNAFAAISSSRQSGARKMSIAESAAEVEFEAQKLPGLKVLVAEDSSITSDLLKLLLSQRGHQVDIVTDGLQALAVL